jgi:AcrR family transcriptional regulator
VALEQQRFHPQLRQKQGGHQPYNPAARDGDREIQRAVPSGSGLFRRHRPSDTSSHTNIVLNPKMMSKQKPKDAAPPELGLRERKKQRTRLEISDIATRMFIERGFENVTVAEVATAASVSVNTVFNYFSTKEELFFDRTESTGWTSSVVRERRHGESAVQALRRTFRRMLRSERLVLPSMRHFVATIEASTALSGHVRLLLEHSEVELGRLLSSEAGAPEGDAKARAVAALVSALVALLLREVRRGILDEVPDATLRATLTKLGEQGFELLMAAAGDYCVRTAEGPATSG